MPWRKLRQPPPRTGPGSGRRRGRGSRRCTALIPTENTTAIICARRSGRQAAAHRPCDHRPPPACDGDGVRHDRGMVVMLRVVMMVAMTVVIAHLDNRDGTISLPAAPNALGLARQEIKSHKGDHRVADAFELIRPGIDLEDLVVWLLRQRRSDGTRHPRGGPGGRLDSGFDSG